MPFDVTIRVKAPEGITSAHVLEYVRSAVKRYGGNLRASDPGFNLGKRCTVLSIRGTPTLPRGMKFHTTSRGETFAIAKQRHER